MANLRFTATGARRATAFTPLHDWVRLSGISAQAISLYWAIKMHVYVLAGDNTVDDVTTETLAHLCGLSRGDKVARYLRELESIKALETVRTGMYGVNTYLVHENPPPGYQGPVTLAQWYAMHDAVLDLRGALAPVDDQENPQVNGVAPKTGEDPQPPVDNFAEPQVNDVPLFRGEHGQFPPKEGNAVAPFRGPFYTQAFSSQRAPSPSASSSSSTAAGGQKPGEKREDLIKPNRGGRARGAVEADLVAELAAYGRREDEWAAAVIAEVLAQPAVRARRWDVVQLAFRHAVADPATWSVRRLLKDLCPHWRWAEAQLRAADDVGTPRPAPRPWCGDCLKTTRLISRDQLDPSTNDTTQVPCPACSPAAVAS